MKKILRNQKGYALVLVLLTITVIGILTIPLMNSVLSSAKQNNITEEKHQLTKISEMGVIYFRHFKDLVGAGQRDELEDQLEAYVENATRRGESISEEDKRVEKREIINRFKRDLEQCMNNETTKCFGSIERPGTVSFTQNEKFQFSFPPDGDLGDPDDDIEVTSKDFSITLTYTSVAKKTSNNATESKQDIVTINFDDIDIPIDDGNSGGDNSNPQCSNGNKKRYDSELNVKDHLIIECDAIFTKKVTVNHGGRIWIYGNATFENEVHIENGGRLFIKSKNKEDIQACFSGGNIGNGGRIFVNGKEITVPKGCY